MRFFFVFGLGLAALDADVGAWDLSRADAPTAALLRSAYDRGSIFTPAAVDGAVGASDGSAPLKCRLVVVGAGWAGAYFAWRAAVDAKLYDASEVCIFEANGRVGGRIFSVHDLPGLEGLALDVGGYRFMDVDALPADLVRALKLPTRCYDAGCAALCPGPPEGWHTCHVLRDVYGNNAGYALPIETMLGQAIDGGGKVQFGARLTSISNANGTSRLAFNDGAFEVDAETVLLNLPRNALRKLTGDWVSPGNEAALFESESITALTKVYASYADAWWVNHLGLSEGNFEVASKDASQPSLQGRYHDGPLKCIVGVDTRGAAIYSGVPLSFGNCSGALEVFYSKTDAFWTRYANDGNDPLRVHLPREDQGELIEKVHSALMSLHAGAFLAAGLDSSLVAPPEMVAVSNWAAEDEYTPSCGSYTGGPEESRKARRPSELNVFVANVDYGAAYCWASGALVAAERALLDLGLQRPAWLNATWYVLRRGVGTNARSRGRHTFS